MTVIIPPSGPPVELTPGGGDLRYSSSPAGPTLVGGKPGSISMVGGKVVSYGDIFATQPWAASAIMKMLTGSVRVPLKTYRRTGGDYNDRERLGSKDHPLAAAINKPWEHGTQAALTQALLGPVLVHGNSTTPVDSGAGDTIRFEKCDFRTVTPIYDDRDVLRGWERSYGDGNPDYLGLDTMMHIAWWSPLGDLGVSPLQQLGTTLSIEDAAQRYQQSVFTNGARPPSAITVNRDELPTDPAERQAIFNQLRADVTSLYANPDNAGRPALLPPGLDWKPVGHTAVEAELIQQREVTREEIAAVYLIPPPMLGILDDATYSNIQTQLQMFYTDSLGAPLVLIEQIINAQIVRDLLGEDDIFVEFDFAGVLRGDRLKEIEALRDAIGTGLMTPNEGRAVLNLRQDGSKGANTLWMPSQNNLAPIDAALDAAAEAVKAAAGG